MKSLTMHLEETFSKYTYNNNFFQKKKSKSTSTKLIPIDGDVNMEINPYITVTSTIAKFDTGDHSFTMMPNQYTVLTHSYSVLPIHRHFGDWYSNKRWGADRPKVTVGTTITFSGFFKRVVWECMYFGQNPSICASWGNKHCIPTHLQ